MRRHGSKLRRRKKECARVKHDSFLFLPFREHLVEARVCSYFFSRLHTTCVPSHCLSSLCSFFFTSSVAKCSRWTIHTKKKKRNTLSGVAVDVWRDRMSAKVTVHVSLKERREKKKDDASLPGAFFLYTLSSFTIIIIFSLSHARNALDLVFSIQLVLRANGMCKGEGGGVYGALHAVCLQQQQRMPLHTFESKKKKRYVKREGMKNVFICFPSSSFSLFISVLLPSFPFSWNLVLLWPALSLYFQYWFIYPENESKKAYIHIKKKNLANIFFFSSFVVVCLLVSLSSS